jgi:hypothetical protein
MKSFFVSLFLTIIVSAENYKLEASLDMFINLPSAYDITPASLEKSFKKGTFSKNPYFSWLNEEKSRAIFKKNSATNVFVDLTILEKSIKVDELIIDFEGRYFQRMHHLNFQQSRQWASFPGENSIVGHSRLENISANN